MCTVASIISDAELARIQRPAVFFDRDGTLNVDIGYTYRPDDLVFLPGARSTIKHANDLGYYVFIITNQAGIARGYYSEAEMHAFHARMKERLAEVGAHIDDIRFCPHHPEGTIEGFAHACEWRKPNPGMILDLMKHWPVIAADSLVVGNAESDMDAAKAAGLRGVLYEGGNLHDLVVPLLFAEEVRRAGA